MAPNYVLNHKGVGQALNQDFVDYILVVDLIKLAMNLAGLQLEYLHLEIRQELAAELNCHKNHQNDHNYSGNIQHPTEN